MDWMYKDSSKGIDHEEYLLGKAVDKNFELSRQESAQTKEPDSGNAQIDLARKVHEDPLFAIKKKQMDMREQLLKNPVKLKKLQEMMEQKKSAGSKKRKKEKEKKTLRDSDYEAMDGEFLDKLLISKYAKLKRKYNISLFDLIKNIGSSDSESEKKSKKKSKRSKRKCTSSDRAFDSSNQDRGMNVDRGSKTNERKTTEWHSKSNKNEEKYIRHDRSQSNHAQSRAGRKSESSSHYNHKNDRYNKKLSSSIGHPEKISKGEMSKERCKYPELSENKTKTKRINVHSDQKYDKHNDFSENEKKRDLDRRKSSNRNRDADYTIRLSKENNHYKTVAESDRNYDSDSGYSKKKSDSFRKKDRCHSSTKYPDGESESNERSHKQYSKVKRERDEPHRKRKDYSSESDSEMKSKSSKKERRHSKLGDYQKEKLSRDSQNHDVRFRDLQKGDSISRKRKVEVTEKPLDSRRSKKAASKLKKVQEGKKSDDTSSDISSDESLPKKRSERKESDKSDSSIDNSRSTKKEHKQRKKQINDSSSDDAVRKKSNSQHKRYKNDHSSDEPTAKKKKLEQKKKSSIENSFGESSPKKNKSMKKKCSDESSDTESNSETSSGTESESDSASVSSSSTDSDDEDLKTEKLRSRVTAEMMKRLKNYGLQLPAGAKIKTKSSPAMSWVEKKETKPIEKETIKRPAKVLLTEEEKEKKMQEMVENAKWRDEERKNNMDRFKKEEEKETKKKYDEGFMRNMLIHASSQRSVAGRIKSNVNNIQRSQFDMDKNFTKR